MRFVGIDPGLTVTGISIYADGQMECRSVKSSLKDGTVFERQLLLLKRIVSLVEPGDVISLEDFGLSGRFTPSGRFVERIELLGMLKFLLPKRTGLPFLMASPGRVKKIVAGKGTAKKDEVVSMVRGFFRKKVKNDDEADSYGLAMLSFFGVRFPMTRTEFHDGEVSVDLNKKRVEAIREFQKENLDTLRRIKTVAKAQNWM